MVAGQAATGVVKRYGRRFDSSRLPRTQAKRRALAETIGRDGFALLAAICDEPALLAVRELAVVERMRRIWIRHYYCMEDEVHWRTKKN